MNSDYIENNRIAYDTLSQEYANRSKNRSEYEESPDFLVDNILKFIPSSNRYAVLEIGPGSGDIINTFDKKGHLTVAVELSREISLLAKKNSPSSIIINSNILDVTFIDNQFDIIYVGAVIHLFPERDAIELLNRLYCWLKQDGVLFINTTISDKTEEGYFIKSDYKDQIKRFRRKWVEKDFKQFVCMKFSVIKTLYTNELDRDKVWVGYICKKYD